MRTTRRLTLRTETLTELRADELTSVYGAAAAPTNLRVCETLLQPCDSLMCR